MEKRLTNIIKWVQELCNHKTMHVKNILPKWLSQYSASVGP
jgi:hypothetical protein